MADVPVGGRYRLVYLVFNTFYNLLTQDHQVRCFENVARHARGGGWQHEPFTARSWRHVSVYGR